MRRLRAILASRDSRSAGCARRRATAALEFALATPLLVIMLGGAADFGLMQFYRICLANAVAAGAQYAILTGSSVTAAAIETVVTDAMPAGTIVSFPSAPAPKGYCVTGSAPTMTSQTAGTTCSDGSTAGTYVIITASFTHNGLMNGFMAQASTTITESATARLN